jgi:hypothetical protein
MAPLSRSDIQIHHHHASTAARPTSSLLPLFEYRGTRIPITEQFPDTTSAIASIVVDRDVVSLDGCNDAIETEAAIDSLQSSWNPTPRGSSFNHDQAPPRRATATRLHLARHDAVSEALRWFLADPGVSFVKSGSAHDGHIAEEHCVTAMLREWRAELSVPSPASSLLQLVVPVKEEELPSTLPDRCLKKCLPIIQRCFSFPFSCSWDAVLCWQYRPWRWDRGMGAEAAVGWGRRRRRQGN